MSRQAILTAHHRASANNGTAPKPFHVLTAAEQRAGGITTPITAKAQRKLYAAGHALKLPNPTPVITPTTTPPSGGGITGGTPTDATAGGGGLGGMIDSLFPNLVGTSADNTGQTTIGGINLSTIIGVLILAVVGWIVYRKLRH